MNVGFLYRGDHLHPVHADWADEIDATVHSVPAPSLPSPLDESVLSDVELAVRRPLPERCDAYVVESPDCLYLLPWLTRRDPDVQIVFLHTTWRLRGAASHSWRNRSRLFRAGATVDRTFDKMALNALIDRYVDAVIGASDICLDDVSDSIPSRTVHPYIPHEEVQALRSNEPAYGSQNVLFFGKNRSHKGVDLLLAAWRDADTGDATLHLVGPGTDVHDGPTVAGHGFVDDPSAWFRRASFVIHPAHFDAFPVGTLETMCAGLPTVVTENTGTKTVARRVSDDLVVPSTKEGLTTGLERFLALSASELREQGAAVRDAVSPYTEQRQAGEFKRAFGALVRDD